MKKLISIIVLVSSFIGFQSGTGFSQNSNNVTLMSRWLKPGQCRNVYVAGNFAYLVSGNVMTILDISDTSRIVGKGEYITSNVITWITVQSNDAYLLTWDNVMEIVDISNPLNPHKVGDYSVQGDVVAVSGNYAYVAARDSGLKIVDVSNPAQPAGVYSYGTGTDYVKSVFISGNYAYLAELSNGLHILDISVSNSPVLVSSFPADYSISNVFVSGNYAYMIDGGRFFTVDVTDPSSPDSVSIFSSNLDDVLFVSGNTVITNEFNMFNIFDVSNPFSPTQVGDIFSSGGFSGLDPSQISIVGNDAFLPYGDWGMEIVDISNPASPATRLYYNDLGQNTQIIKNGNNLFTMEGAATSLFLNVYDVSDIAHPQYVNYYEIGFGGYSNYALYGNNLLLTSTDPELKILDISSPLQITPIGTYDLNASVQSLGVDVLNNYAFVCMQDSGLYILDIGNPSLPLKISSIILANGHKAQQVKLSGNIAYVTDDINVIHAIDISTITAPVERGSLQLATTGMATYIDGDAISISGNFAYVSLHDNGMAIVDISNPDSLAMLSVFTAVDDARKNMVIGQYVFLADYLNGLIVIDVSNPNLPTQAGYYFEHTNYYYTVFADTDFIYLGATNGLYIFNNDFSNGINQLQVDNPDFLILPNPANENITVMLPNANENFNVTILNIQGEIIQEQQVKKNNAKINISNLPSGVYLIEVNNDTFSGIAKFIKE